VGVGVICHSWGCGSVVDSVHHVPLAMPRGEQAAARAFFVDVLGMTEIDKPAVLAARGGVWFGAGGVERHLDVEDDVRPAGKAHPGIVVNDLTALVEHRAGAGHNMHGDRNFPGFRRAYAHDPFGNRLEFLEPSPIDAGLSARLAESGGLRLLREV
jgi:catechol 2,3-dioxygenase-like lactoylglutathione lyase family enzyme